MASPIAALIVRILADVSEIKDSLNNIEGNLNKFKAVVAGIGKALVAAFSITAIVTFAKQTIDMAGRMTDLAAKTGFTTDALQKFGLVFEENGVSIDIVTRAATDLQRRLVEGDKSTVSALGKLGLSADALKRLKPEDMFLAVADAVGKIPNPAEKAWAAMQLFGRGGVELLPALTGHLGEAAARFEELGLIISENTLQAADTFGDQLGLMGRQMMALMATALGPVLPLLTQLGNVLIWVGNRVIGPILLASMQSLMTALSALWIGVSTIIQGFADLASRLPGVGDKFKGIAEWMEASRAKSKAFIVDIWTGTEKVAESAPKATGALIGFGRGAEEAAAKASKFRESVEATLTPLQGLRIAIPKVATAAADIRAEAGLLSSRELPLVVARLDDIGQIGGTAFDTVRRKAATFGDFLRTELGPSILAAFQGGGNVGRSIGGVLGGFFTNASSGVGQTIAGGLSSALGSTLGGAIGSIIPGLGTALGGLAGGLIGKLFSNPEKQINPIREAFVQAAGGLHALNVKAQEAGVTLAALLDAKNPKQYEAAIRDLQAAFEFQTQAMQTLDETTKRYNFTIDELGPAFQRQELDKQAQQLFKDFEVLKAAGIDQVLITEKMSGAVNSYVQQALRMGLEIPSAMRPQLEQMAKLGLLLDENGQVITSLEDAGVKFALTMSDGFKALISEVQKLTDAISRGLGLAIHNIPQPGPINIPVNYQIPDLDDLLQLQGVPGFQHGTGGRFVDFGRGTPVVLHGRERVVTEAEGRAAQSGSASGELGRLRRDMQMFFDRLPLAIRAAMA